MKKNIINNNNQVFIIEILWIDPVGGSLSVFNRHVQYECHQYWESSYPLRCPRVHCKSFEKSWPDCFQLSLSHHK